MKQQEFETRYAGEWEALEQALAPRKDAGPEFPEQYRRLCHQLALAKQRRYSAHLVGRLNELVLQGHQRLYGADARHRDQLLRFVVVGFPRTLRDNARLVALAAALFIVPLLLMGVACFLDDDLIYSLMPAGEVRHFENIYQPDNDKFGRDRASDTDLMMFGYYINNNIGVSFRTFAGGVLFGIGSAFFLLYNGLMIGGVGGHVAQQGLGATFFPFVIGHGAFELTAIVFSGAAGLKLGLALLDPGPYSRLHALREAGREVVKIMYGVMLMLVIAAFLEAFWSSSSTLPPALKYGVGATFWLLVLAYCFGAGRNHAAR